MPATAASPADKGVVLFDGDCPFCQKSVALLKRLDWFHVLDFHNCRDGAGIPSNAAHLDPQRMIEEMHLLTPDRTTAYAGFRAFRWIAGRLPMLWAIYPFLFLPGVPRVGQRLYLWVAKNRFNLVPCRDGVCTIPPRRK